MTNNKHISKDVTDFLKQVVPYVTFVLTSLYLAMETMPKYISNNKLGIIDLLAITLFIIFTLLSLKRYVFEQESLKNGSATLTTSRLQLDTVGYTDITISEDNLGNITIKVPNNVSKKEIYKLSESLKYNNSSRVETVTLNKEV